MTSRPAAVQIEVHVPDAVTSRRRHRLAGLEAARPAVAATVHEMRRLLRSWSAENDIDEDTRETIVLAVDEAVTNAVEHAFREQEPGEVRLLVTSTDGRLTVVVADDGTWRPVPDDPGYRGRGLAMIHRLADQVRIDRGGHGTTVLMSWDRT